jgi:hypothetical protein
MPCPTVAVMTGAIRYDVCINIASGAEGTFEFDVENIGRETLDIIYFLNYDYYSRMFRHAAADFSIRSFRAASFA